MKIKVVTLALFALALFSCQNRNAEDLMLYKQDKLELVDSTRLIGKRVRLVYPEYTAFESFQSDTFLKWTSVDVDGLRHEGKERISYTMVDNNVHFVTWVNSNGDFVSQVIDTKAMKVYTYITSPQGAKKHSKAASAKVKSLSGTVKFQN